MDCGVALRLPPQSIWPRASLNGASVELRPRPSSRASPGVGKAALKRPHSKRFAQDEASAVARQRLECGRFSAVFDTAELFETGLFAAPASWRCLVSTFSRQ